MGYIFGKEITACIIFYAVMTVPFLINFRSLPSISTLSLFSLIAYGCVILSFFVDAVLRFKGDRDRGMQNITLTGWGNDEDGDNDGDEDDFAGDGNGFVQDWLLPQPTSLTVIGTVLYCFGNGFNSLVIYNNLRMRRIERGLNVMERSSNISLALIFLFTVSGFAAYLPRHNEDGEGGMLRINIFRHEGDSDDDDTKIGMRAGEESDGMAVSSSCFI